MSDALYRCDECGLRFVLNLEPKVICLTHRGEEHCHLGETLVAEDGWRYRAAAGAECQAARWITAEMKCSVCSHDWVAVYPETAPKLECPRCGFRNLRHDKFAGHND